MYKISIIIAQYNTEKYIEETIVSIIKQMLKEVQIIIIDDESTDNSITIVKQLQQNHNNIELYTQKNQGPAIARNFGMKKATGKYIMFLDSDDLLAENALQNLYNTIEKYDSDVVIGSYRSFNQNNRKGWYHNFAKSFVGMEFYNKSLDDIPKLIRSLPVWNKIYLRTFLEDNAIHFYEDVHLREDAYFMAKVFAHSNKISHIPFDVTFYRIREKSDVSLTHHINSKVFEDIIQISTEIDKIFFKRNFTQIQTINKERYITELIAINFRLKIFMLNDSSDFLMVMIELNHYLEKIDEETISFFSLMNSNILFLIKQKQYNTAKDISNNGYDHLLFNENIFREDLLITNFFLKQQAKEIERLKKIQLKKSKTSIRRQGKELYYAVKNKLSQKRKTFLRRSYFYLIGKAADFKTKKSEIWLIGERLGTSAQDTGYHFFRYCREIYPKKEIYFVTKKENITPELLDIGNVVEMGTIKHHILLLAATVHIFNDNYRDLCEKWNEVRKTKQVKVVCFLQHGIIALSKIHGYYDYINMAKRANTVDIFVTSSEFEQNIVVNALGHKDENVIITGLSRFDNLYNNRHVRNKKIVYIPTWRNWLKSTSEEEFINSEYYKETLNVIDTVLKLQQDYTFDFDVCFHHAFKKFTHLYKHKEQINFIDMSHINVQDLIIDTGMLITDYSSISFDFAFMEKPVIFYQFDRENFLKVRGGSFIDYETELFGPVVHDLSALSNSIKLYIDNKYKMYNEDKEKANRYFSYHDNKNSQRIFNIIEKKLNEKSFI